MDDNRKRKIIKMEELKNETMQAIQQIIENKHEKRKVDIRKQISNIIVNAVKEILKQKRIELDEEYAQGQLDVLISEIEKGNKELDYNLLTQINSLLNRHIEYAIDYSEKEERDMHLKRNELRLDDEFKGDEATRHRKINNNQIPKIEEYLYDIFSHEMRKIEHRGISLTKTDRESLKYEILSRLKYRGTEKIAEFFESQNVDLNREIKAKFLEFFEEIDKEVSEQETQEKKKTNAMMFEHFEIDHELAQQRAIEKSEGIETLPSDVIK